MVGYTGPSCEIVINSCSSTPCQNRATCQRISPVGYNCICPPNFTGTNCDVQVNPCSSNPCSTNGVCTPTANGYTCQCLTGFTGQKYLFYNNNNQKIILKFCSYKKLSIFD